MSEKIKVLIVDDEAQFRVTTKKLLDRRGFNTIVAESGEAAIHKLKENPDVVILDVKMPGMDGHQALRETKKLASHVPVIMLTGHGALPSAREALVEGAFDYLAKPCDMDLLASKITDAYEHSKKRPLPEEKRVIDAMVPLEDFTMVKEEKTIKDAIQILKDSLTAKVSTSRIMETKHRSILVFDEKGNMEGILTVTDLLSSIMPAYLSAPKPSTADSVQYSPMFWKGMFIREVKALAKKKMSEIMSPAPLTIDGESNLLEATYIMVSNNVRRLVVVSKGEVVGVIRELDLFFEMNRILRE
ncbi:MAG: response regulator [Desulfobacteraceae bacterium]|nr:MAG: response regulator [Desulfobacteraceae bacterium]